MLRGTARAMTFLLAGLAASAGWPNGGPFVVKYPEGDPAAKGVLARLGPDLKPTRETRLRVVKEDLTVTFGEADFRPNPEGRRPPLASVSAAYTIQNPTAEAVQVDFGFPILRGMYIEPFSMVPAPDVRVTLDEKGLRALVISNSAIYGVIRSGARRAIDRGLAADRRLAGLADDVRAGREGAREALGAYLTGTLGWNERDSALMVEYSGLDLGEARAHPPDQSWLWMRDDQLNELVRANLGPVAAIGEQKATQFLAQLSGRFEPETAAAYEAIFSAWGGDVRERSVDLRTGDVRPRELGVDAGNAGSLAEAAFFDPTIYARVDYLDENAPITDAEKASCKAILKNLPVVFTFAPMNLLYYQATFPPGQTCALTVRYAQYAYRDTRDPASFQLAYVVHPASLWDAFGPISLEAAVPEGIAFRASVPSEKIATEERNASAAPLGDTSARKSRFDVYRGAVTDKTGELFLAIDAAAWQKRAAQSSETAQAPQSQQRQP